MNKDSKLINLILKFSESKVEKIECIKGGINASLNASLGGKTYEVTCTPNGNNPNDPDEDKK